MEYTIAEAAARAGVSESTIRAARASGAFKSARQDEAKGKRTPRWLIAGTDLDAAGFVPITAGATATAAGPIFIEQRLMQVSAQLGEMLDVLARHDDVFVDWMVQCRDTASSTGEMLQTIVASTRGCAAAEQLAALHNQVARLAAEAEARDRAGAEQLDALHDEVARLASEVDTRDRRLASVAVEIAALRTSLEAWKPRTVVGPWSRVISAIRG